ncbi:MAG: hypothetical protein Q7S68_05650, partial [Deltaproteobacteria bacterium]|nr:hypothetical protein [Deltaproteobacteria bacterium]
MTEGYKSLEVRSLDQAKPLPESEQAKAKPKEGRSTFDDLLDQSMRLQQGSVDTKQKSKEATQQAVQESHKHKDKEREHSKEEDSKEGGSQQNQNHRDTKGSDHKRVVGKSSLKEDQGNSGSGFFQGGGKGEMKQAKKLNLANKKVDSPDLAGHKGAENDFSNAFKAKLTATNPKSASQVLSKEVLDQILR